MQAMKTERLGVDDSSPCCTGLDPTKALSTLMNRVYVEQALWGT